MQKNKVFLLTTSLLVFPITLLLFLILPEQMSARSTFIYAMTIYWILLIIFSTKIILGEFKNIKKLIIPLHQPKAILSYYVFAFTPVPGVFLVSFLPNIMQISISNLFIIILISLINSIIEEFYWRGLFVINFKNSIRFGIIFSTVFFALWHFSLLTINGISYHGGYLGLVGGALFMGLIWSYVAQRTGNIFYTITAHVLVNIFAFTGLFAANYF